MDFLCTAASCKAFTAFAAFAFVYVSDILLGVINNVVIKGQPFAWRRLFNSFVKVVVGALVLAALVTAELLAGRLELPVSQDTVGLVTLTAFVLLFWQGFREGVTGIYQKLRSMFGIKGAETPAPGTAEDPVGQETPSAEASAEPLADGDVGALHFGVGAPAESSAEPADGGGSGALRFDVGAPTEAAPPAAGGAAQPEQDNADVPDGRAQALEGGGVEFLDDEDAGVPSLDFEIKDGEQA